METTAVRAPDISVRGIGKSYSGVSVLRDIDLDIAPGEVHSLVGENGAGKSTLLKILAGAITADAGTMEFDGQQVSISTPRDALAHGISLISQEGALVPALSVLENVFLARWSHRAGLRVTAQDRQRFDELLEQTGFSLDPKARVDGLPIGRQQIHPSHPEERVLDPRPCLGRNVRQASSRGERGVELALGPTFDARHL